LLDDHHRTPRLEIFSKWTLRQQKVFLATYLKNDKNFDLIKKNLNDTKTSKEIIEFYYLVKHLPKFKSAREMKQESDSYNEKLKNITSFNKNTITALFTKDDSKNSSSGSCSKNNSHISTKKKKRKGKQKK